MRLLSFMILFLFQALGSLLCCIFCNWIHMLTTSSCKYMHNFAKGFMPNVEIHFFFYTLLCSSTMLTIRIGLPLCPAEFFEEFSLLFFLICFIYYTICNSQQLSCILIAPDYLDSQEYKYIASKRLSYFHSSKPQLHQFTILVHSIPTSSSCSISDTVENFFKELYPSTYLSHVVIHRKHKIQSFLVRILYNFNLLSCFVS